MFNLTHEEKKVVLFLVSIALIGTGINFCLKVKSPIKKFILADINIAKINLNTASLQDLLESRALSKRLAKEIIEYRLAHGGFSDIEELKEIKGIGEYKYEKLKELFFVK